jgi:hypothetical protein
MDPNNVDGTFAALVRAGSDEPGHDPSASNTDAQRTSTAVISSTDQLTVTATGNLRQHAAIFNETPKAKDDIKNNTIPR